MVAVEWNTWAVLYGALAALAVLVLAVALSRIVRRPAPAPAGDRTLAQAVGEGVAEPFMARRVEGADGRAVGETIGLHGALVVLKHEGGFRAVPMERILVQGDRLVAAADIDWEAAAREGEAWRAAGHAPVRYDAAGNPVKDE